MGEKKPFCLTDQQKVAITKLLNLSPEKSQVIFDELERLVEFDSWTELYPNNKVKAVKLASARVVNLNAISKSFGELATVLSEVDPLILSHLDDQFSFLQFQISRERNTEKAGFREIQPLSQIVPQIRDWAQNAADTIKSTDARGHLYRFLCELDDFCYWQLDDSVTITDTKLSKLTSILLGVELDAARKQVGRWREKQREDKSQE
jgi:hypothetical protein